jgi:hypothetical protein
MRMKIEGMMRAARGWDKLSQAFACLVETIESRSPMIATINFASRADSWCQLQIVRSHPQQIATQAAIERTGKHLYEYRPGDNLSDYVRYYILADSEGTGLRASCVAHVP